MVAKVKKLCTEEKLSFAYLCICVQAKEITALHLLCVGLRNLFFQLCCCVNFWFWREIGFGLHTYILRVQYSCSIVLVFWFWQEIVFGVTHVLSVQYSCAVVSVSWLWQEIVLKMKTPFDFL
jgi:hypothetical protein